MFKFVINFGIPIAFVFHPKFFSYRSSGEPCAIYRLFQCDFIIISNLHQKTRKINEKLSTRVDFSIRYVFTVWPRSKELLWCLKVSYFEMSFWCLQFFQNTNENNSTWCNIIFSFIFWKNWRYEETFRNKLTFITRAILKKVHGVFSRLFLHLKCTELACSVLQGLKPILDLYIYLSTVKLWLLTRLVYKHMMTFSDCLWRGFSILM